MHTISRVKAFAWHASAWDPSENRRHKSSVSHDMLHGQFEISFLIPVLLSCLLDARWVTLVKVGTRCYLLAGTLPAQCRRWVWHPTTHECWLKSEKNATIARLLQTDLQAALENKTVESAECLPVRNNALCYTAFHVLKCFVHGILPIRGIPYPQYESAARGNVKFVSSVNRLRVTRTASGYTERGWFRGFRGGSNFRVYAVADHSAGGARRATRCHRAMDVWDRQLAEIMHDLQTSGRVLRLREQDGVQHVACMRQSCDRWVRARVYRLFGGVANVQALYAAKERQVREGTSACVRACVRACVHACVCACVIACVRVRRCASARACVKYVRERVLARMPYACRHTCARACVNAGKSPRSRRDQTGSERYRWESVARCEEVSAPLWKRLSTREC
eukprot:678736-Pleurochrysis_carterae.AAC.1